MPEICKFYGIIISLYWRDHNPPHIHFTYGEYECSISVLDRVVDGKAPSKVIAKVNEWMDLHEAEILTLWDAIGDVEEGEGSTYPKRKKEPKNAVKLGRLTMQFSMDFARHLSQASVVRHNPKGYLINRKKYATP